MSIDVKICGINDPIALKAAISARAQYVGLVFCARSPRFVTIDAAQQLAKIVPAHITVVGLFVDPKDEELTDIIENVPLGMIQLHGRETPARVHDIRHLTILPIMKAIGISTADDFKKVPAYEAVADQLLFDAKPPVDAVMPGGNAKAFDWSLMRGQTITKPWMLAGGLNVHNLAEAVRATDARGIDVSSGVEDSPGHKNPDKIRELIALARQL